MNKTGKTDLFGRFQAITLQELNSKAAMLERLDNKYVIRQSVLARALGAFQNVFDILEIEGKRQFTYETCYFDDADYRSYFDHHQGRRRRLKVRVRKYTDAQLCFVEVKLKGRRGITVKKRLDYSVDRYGTLDDSAYQHIDESYQELYGEPFRRELGPVIEMRYQRVTLVAKEGGERMTVDCNLEFVREGTSRSIDPEVFIVETKSANGNGIADRILRSFHQHPTRRCSKYCAGMAAVQAVARYNKFLPALRKMGVVPQDPLASSPQPSAIDRLEPETNHREFVTAPLMMA
jgi:hypothetical protein